MKRIGVVCTLLVFITLVIPSSVLSVCSDMEINEIVNNNDSSLSLIIEEVSMSDHNVVCSMLGGQNVSICVRVRNQGDEDFNGTFSVKIFTDQISYLEQQNVTEPIGGGYSKRVHFLDVHISEEIGKHTLDAYINDNISTRSYCEFKSTLIGIDTLNVVDSSPGNYNQGKVSIAQIYLKLDKTITVDDDGGADYTNIQDAIDAASNGDTIFVYNGMYHETVSIDKSIHLMGEDKHETIIDGTNISSLSLVSIISPNVHLEGFSLIDADEHWGETTAIIAVKSNGNIIENNVIITNVRFGIQLYSRVKKNSIMYNYVTALDAGIKLEFSSNNFIYGNQLVGGKGQHYDDKVCQFCGINAGHSNFNNITFNHIAGNGMGVRMDNSNFNHFSKNNYMNVGDEAYSLPRININYWDSNYWDCYQGILPFYFISGRLILFFWDFLRVDWHPASEPYDIN